MVVIVVMMAALLVGLLIGVGIGRKANAGRRSLLTVAQMPRTLAESQQQIMDFLRRGEKINAIKVYREAYGVGLKDAKNAVEAIEAGQMQMPGFQATTSAFVPLPGTDAEVEALIRQGMMVHAIKKYREIYGVGLKDAKDAVEAMERNLRQ